MTEIIKARVPRQGAGAEQLVLAMKSSNVDGAKELHHSHVMLLDQLVIGGV